MATPLGRPAGLQAGSAQRWQPAAGSARQPAPSAARPAWGRRPLPPRRAAPSPDGGVQAAETSLLSEAEKFVLEMAEEEAAAAPPPLPPAAAEAPELQAQLAALKAQVGGLG